MTAAPRVECSCRRSYAARAVRVTDESYEVRPFPHAGLASRATCTGVRRAATVPSTYSGAYLAERLLAGRRCARELVILRPGGDVEHVDVKKTLDRGLAADDTIDDEDALYRDEVVVPGRAFEEALALLASLEVRPHKVSRLTRLREHAGDVRAALDYTNRPAQVAALRRLARRPSPLRRAIDRATTDRATTDRATAPEAPRCNA